MASTKASDKTALVEDDEVTKESSKEATELATMETHSIATTDDSDSVSMEPRSSTSVKCCGQFVEGLTIVIICVVAFSGVVTLALIIHILVGEPQVLPHASVVSQDIRCSKIGLDLLRLNTARGVSHFTTPVKLVSSLDAAIATYICLTVTRPDLVSVGGDCGLVLQHRHVIPAAASTSTATDTKSSPFPSTLMNGLCPAPESPSSNSKVGLPRFINTLFEMHKKDGLLSWNRLFEGALKLAESGFKISPALAENLRAKNSNFGVLNQTGDKNLWANYSKPAGTLIHPPDEYVALLRHLANVGVHDLYNPSNTLGQDYLAVNPNWKAVDLALATKLINQTDSLVKINFGEYWVVAPPLPSVSGAIVAGVLRSLPPLSWTKETPSYFVQLVEALKVAQATVTQLAGTSSNISIVSEIWNRWNSWPYKNRTSSDPAVYNASVAIPESESHGGASVIVVDEEHNYLALSATLGSPFGAGQITSSGQVLNNVLSMIPSSATIQPQQQPWTTLSPLAVFHGKRKCGPRFLISANGGLESASAVVQTILEALVFEQACDAPDCLKMALAISRPRVHVQLQPQGPAPVWAEASLAKDAVEALRAAGHNVTVLGRGETLALVLAAGKLRHEYVSSGDERSADTEEVSF